MRQRFFFSNQVTEKLYFLEPSLALKKANSTIIFVLCVRCRGAKKASLFSFVSSSFLLFFFFFVWVQSCFIKNSFGHIIGLEIALI